jgi:predicted transcriptional regulator
MGNLLGCFCLCYAKSYVIIALVSAVLTVDQIAVELDWDSSSVGEAMAELANYGGMFGKGKPVA